MRLILSSLGKRDPAALAHDRAVFDHVSEVLAAGGTLHHDNLPEIDNG
jgi:hypothetical protein